MIENASGNLLTANVDALVNTVNTVGVMGKGIALQFKRAFPGNFRAYEAACRRGEVQLGKMFVHQLQQLDGPTYIINFPTKANWRAKSRLEDIESGLLELREVISKLNITSIAVPPLGCGNGGLNWTEVRPMIEDQLGSLSAVRVLLFGPEGAPDVSDMPIRTRRPRMTRFGAALLVAYDSYIARSMESGLAVEPKLALLEAHKVAYFLQESGWPLRLKFTKGHYGPYSESLDHFISSVEGHFISGHGDGTSGSKAALSLNSEAVKEGRHLLEHDPDYWRVLKRLHDVLDGFEFPYGVELLSTVHFAAQHLTEAGESADRVIAAVQEWSPRKKKFFKPTQAAAAYDHLSEAGLLPA